MEEDDVKPVCTPLSNIESHTNAIYVITNYKVSSYNRNGHIYIKQSFIRLINKEKYEKEALLACRSLAKKLNYAERFVKVIQILC